MFKTSLPEHQTIIIFVNKQLFYENNQQDALRLIYYSKSALPAGSNLGEHYQIL